MKAALLILVVAAAAVAVPVQWLELEKAVTISKGPARLGDIYSFCNTSAANDLIVFNKISIAPDPPVKGKKLTFTVDYDLKEEVKGGTVKLSVKMGSINIYSNTLGLCDLLSEAGMSCPVAVDHNGHASFSQVVPSEFPGGHYTGNVEVTDQNGKQMACVNVKLNL